VSTRLDVLGSDECYRLLEGGVVGRVGITVLAVPEVLPVSYRLLDGDIVFRTGQGTKLCAATSDAPIAFEIDGSDPAALSGWSVLVLGLTKEVTDPEEIARALAILPNGWVPQEQQHVIRLSPARVSGLFAFSRGAASSG
jgi:uncharacterized protein